ncbi:MAG TPA: HAD family hydrolase [Nitrososphaerales archaeon]|nr:HAD family hydrolase [Nitrososphaerales archaeon]
MPKKAILLDRDGVLNEMSYYPDHGIVDSPFTVSRLVLTEGIGEALRSLKSMGYLLVVVSNQPGIAKKHFTMETFKKMQRKMNRMLADEGIRLDGEYYCFHHPRAKVAKYRVECDCRKPKPGLLLRAADELGLDLTDSVMIGDGLSDVVAGKAAGTKTVLVTNLNSLVNSLVAERGVEPDFVARDVTEAADIVKNDILEVVRR